MPSIGSDPNAVAAAGRQAYARTRNISPQQFHGAFITPTATEAIASAYSRLPNFDPRAVPAFKAMRDEVNHQFDHMTAPAHKGGMGIDVTVQHHDPYGIGGGQDSAFRELDHDVSHNHHIGVLSTQSTGGHPFFTNDENDKFRAVHDVFGHLATGRGVDRHGEEAAYRSHASMFSPLARQAMATETRGQNSAFVQTRAFQDQKVAVLPSHMLGVQFAQQGPAVQRSAAAAQAKQFNRNQGI